MTERPATSALEGRAIVLVVEDDMHLAREMGDALADYGMAPVLAESWERALTALTEVRPAVILLDQWLGTTDALPLLPMLRELSDAAVVMVSGNLDEADRIIALETGADGFLLKPVSGRELVARVRVQLRHRQRRAAVPPPPAPGWHLDRRRRILHRPDGTQVDLTAAEFDLIAVLADGPGRALDRDTLTRLVLHRPWRSDDRSLDNLVARVRRKLGPHGERAIATIRGQGYAFIAFPGG